MAQLPFMKLAAMFLKVLTKPLAARIKYEASRFSTVASACDRVGQQAHSFYMRMSVLASGYKFLGVKPLPKDEAIEQGAAYIADGVVMTLGSAIIITEYQKSEAKNQQKALQSAAKEAAATAYIESRFTDLDSKLQSLSEAFAAVNKKLEEATESRSQEPPPKSSSNRPWLLTLGPGK